MNNTLSKPLAVIYSHTGLRGLAAMYVVVFHFLGGGGPSPEKESIKNFFSYGEYPVDLFFVLSGFILNWVYLPDNTPLNWRSYFSHRIARILPLYYLTSFLMIPLIVYYIITHGSYFFFTTRYLLGDVIQNLFLISGITDGGCHTFNGPAWSISVEFFCYLTVFPALVFFKRAFSKRHYCSANWLFLAGVFTYIHVVSHSVSEVPIWHWMWDGGYLMRGISGFVVGFCLCSAYQKRANWTSNLCLVNLAVLFPLGIIFFVGFGFLPDCAALYSLPFLVFFSAIDRGAAAKLLKTKTIQWLGERSYSIYLWHMLLISRYTGFLQNHLPRNVYFVFAVILILCVSELSYRFFEYPCREYLRKFSFSAAKRNSARH